MIDERLMFYFYLYRSLEIANDIFSNIGSEINELAGDVTELQVGMFFFYYFYYNKEYSKMSLKEKKSQWLYSEYLWVSR